MSVKEQTCYYTEGYIKTVTLANGAVGFSVDPTEGYAFSVEDESKNTHKKLIVVEETTGPGSKIHKNVVASVEGDGLKLEDSAWICANVFVTLKTNKNKIRLCFKKGNYQEIIKLEVL